MSSHSISDEEVRDELIRLGEVDVPPITETTRGLLKKKLERLLNEKRSSQRESQESSSRSLRSRTLRSNVDEHETVVNGDSTARQRVTPRRSMRNATSRYSPNQNNNGFVPNRGLEATARRDGHVASSMARLSLGELSDSEADTSIYTVTNASMNTSLPYSSPTSGAGLAARLRRRFTREQHTPPPPAVLVEENRHWMNRAVPHLSRVFALMLLVLFITLAMAYVSLKKQHADVVVVSSDEDILQLPDCTSSDLECDRRMRSAIDLIQHLAEELNAREVAHACGGDTEKPTHLSRVVLTNMAVRLSYSTQTVNDALHLLWNNQHWSVKVSTRAGGEASSASNIESLRLSTASLPLTCRIRRAIISALWYIVSTIAVVVLLLLTWRGWRQHKQKKQHRQNQVFNMVERILDVIRDQKEAHEEDPTVPEFLTVNHARDKLIPANQRAAMASIWSEAADYVTKNESRVRTEIQRIAGEEYDVWRWINTLPNERKRGQWQGAACQAAASPTKSAPTECLKIRNMFDAEVEMDIDWPEKVKDAVLEKIGADHGVVHIAVDKQTNGGIVYVLCLTKQDAGIAHQSLNGWWFDGSLVSAKFVRKERYLQRFPEAKGLTRRLTPSQTGNTSLSAAAAYRSLLEDS